MLLKILYFLIFIIIVSCECPPNLDINKEIVPNEFSLICFINLHREFPTIDILSRKLLLLKGLESTSFSESNYLKFPAGYSNLQLKNNGIVIYNSVIASLKNNYYTLIFYQSSNLPHILILEDKFTDSQDNAQIRLVHLADHKKIFVKLTSSLPQPIEINLNSKEFTNLIPFVSGLVNVQIFDYETNELLSELNNIKLESKTITDLIVVSKSNNIEVSVVVARR